MVSYRPFGKFLIHNNENGNVTQHIEYLPFGELLADEHLNSYNSPFKFNAKELDPETGNYYYGARYYNPKTSIWLSVDPLAEKYPNFSPYIYTFNNPLNFVDPTGMEGEGWDDIIIRGKNIMTKEMNEAVIIKTKLIDVTVDIEEMPLIPEIESLTKRVKPIEPIIIEGTDQALNSPLISPPDEADAIVVSLNASFTLLAGATGGYTIAAFLSGDDYGKAFLYSNSIDDGISPVPSAGILAGGGVEVGSVFSNVKDFDRRTLMGYSLNLSGGYGAYSGTVSKGLQSKWAWLKPATYYAVSLGLGGASTKYGGAGTLNYSRLKRQL